MEADLESEYYEELRELGLKARADAEAEWERRVSGWVEPRKEENEWT